MTKPFLHSILLAFLLSPAIAFSQSYLISEGGSFVDEVARNRRVGIEIEFKGLTDQQIIELVKKYYPEAQISGTIESGLNFETDIGKIRIVIEGQAYKYENDPVKYEEQRKKDIVEAPREIVFPPVKFDEIARMNILIAELKTLGAVGTTPTNAVSIQTNLEMNQLTNKKNVKIILDVVRNYLNPEHRKQVGAFVKTPPNRTPYILDFSPGFMKKIADKSYSPTPREFYNDFMYRQSLEILGHKDAWTMDIKEAQKTLLTYQGEAAVVPQVMKMNKIRISSLLLMAFPEDPLTKRVVASRWARPMPVIEIREFNNDFELTPKVRWSLGMVRASELFGAYDHDTLFSNLTGVSKADIKRLRNGLNEGRKTVRYVLQAPESDPLTQEDREWLRRYNKDVIQIQLSPDKVGVIPMILGNGAVVWHRRNIHRETLLGEMNPGLENALMQQALENKLVEALTFNKYAPGSFPETVSLNSLVQDKNATVSQIVQSLSQKFPDGWVLKGAWDLSSEKLIVTDKIDFAKEMAAYEKGFEAFRAKIEAQYVGSDPETIIYHLKKHPGFLGFKIKNLLQNKDLLLVQQRRQLVEEFRVEIQGGKVLGKGSTIPRFAYMKKNKKPLHPVFTAQAESFAQAVIDKLPVELKVLPYAFDVALTSQGDWVLIETNPGGNSSFLEENPKSSRALVEYLAKYEKPKQGLLKLDDQTKWIQKHLAEFSLSADKMYPGIDLGVGTFNDSAYSRTSTDRNFGVLNKEILDSKLSNEFSNSGAAGTCRQIHLSH